MLSDGLQEVLRQAFAEEAQRLLENFDEQLNALELAKSGSDRREQLGNLRRTAHTLKGASRSVEFAEVETLSYALEKKFKSLGTESDEPYLSPKSLSVLQSSVSFLDKTVKALIEDPEALISGKEIIDLTTQIEEISLGDAPGGSPASLPDAERERLRFLVKMLRKTSADSPSEKNFKKAFQILLSLNRVAKDNNLERILPLTEALENRFRGVSEEPGGTKDWPNIAISSELLAEFAKDPGRFESELLSDALRELRESELDNIDGDGDVSEAFLTETSESLSQLRRLINEASENGSFKKKELRVCLMSLTGATRVVDLPTAETICRSLDYSLTTYADAGRAPEALLSRAAEAVELLSQEIDAYAEGKPGLPSWKAMHIVERLDAAVDEIDTLGLDETAPPIPEAKPVSAESKKKSKKKAKKAKTDEPGSEESLASTASVVAGTVAASAAAVAISQSESAEAPEAARIQQRAWATEFLSKTEPVESLAYSLERTQDRFSMLTQLIGELKEENQHLHSLIENSADSNIKDKSQEHFKKHKTAIQRAEAALADLNQDRSERGRLLGDSRAARQSVAETFYASPQVHTEKFQSVLQLELSPEKDCPAWDERYWESEHFKTLVKGTGEYLGASSKGKSKPKIAARESAGTLLLELSTKGKAKALETESAGKLQSEASALAARLRLPSEGEDLRAHIELPLSLRSPRFLVFQAHGKTFTIPTTAVKAVSRVPLDARNQNDFKYLDTTYQVHGLGEQNRYAILLENFGQKPTALFADHLLGEHCSECLSEEATNLGSTGPFPTVEQKSKRNCRVLIVSEYSASASLVATFLERRGHEVTLCTEGSTALGALESNQDEPGFGLLLCDFELSDMHGETLCESARSLNRYKELPCWVLTEADQKHTSSAAVSNYCQRSEFDVLALGKSLN